MPLVQSVVGALALVCAFVKIGDGQVKVVLFGATGMVGQGVLHECLLDPDVESVLAVVRNASLPQHDKLREIVHQDVADLAAVEDSASFGTQLLSIRIDLDC
jgi:dihydrodipicolinate reductase